MNFAGVISDHSEEVLSKELLSAKFKTFAKENFQENIKKDLDYLRYLKKSAQLYSFKLPADKAELYIDIENAPSFWLCDTPALLKAEEGLRSVQKGGRQNPSDTYKTAKEFYSKWVIIPSEAEKRYYALSAIKLIEKDANPHNFMKYILFAVILGFDKKFYSPEKSFEQFNKALEIIEKWNADISVKAEFRYLINLFEGFIFLRQQQFIDANIKFSEALGNKPSGITAKFYSAIAEKKLGDFSNAVRLINEIIDYDKNLLHVAIEKNSFNLLTFAVQNAVTYNIFTVSEHADLLQELEDMIKFACGDDEFSFEHLRVMLHSLTELKLTEFYDDQIVNHILFLEKMVEHFHGNKNKIVAFSINFAKEKFLQIIDLIAENFSKKYTNEMFGRLSVFDEGINENMEAVKYLKHEMEELKKSYKKKFEDVLAVIEKKYAEAVVAVEDRIENLHLSEKFNPQKAFNNSMVYNIIVTILVFIVGGFSGCYGGSIDDVYNYKDVMGTVLLSGLKWGVVTFFIGSIIAVFSSVFAYMEKMTEKQSLVKKITYLKSQKDKELEISKREHEKKMKSVNDNFNERITEHEKNIEKLKSEKEEQFKILKEETDKIIEQHTEKLHRVLEVA